MGPKSAQRMAHHLLRRNRQGGQRLAEALARALDKVRLCALCNTFSDESVCSICSNPQRERGLLCVVETPADALAIENTRVYKGLYFVLGGALSPLDGVGPLALPLEKLLARASVAREVILATNFTAEGEATAHFLADKLKGKGLGVTRIARGMPFGGEFEYVDLGTAAQALLERRVF